MPQNPRRRKAEKSAPAVANKSPQIATQSTVASSPATSNFRQHLRTAAYRIIMIIIITILTRRFQSDVVKSLHDEVIPYKVVPLPGKGKGMIASGHIEHGERIITEKPLFLLPQTIAENPVQYINEKLALLSEEQRYEFFNLSHADTGIPEHQIPISIIQTNGIAAGSNQLGIFPRTARMNHGCSSAFNSVYSYREKDNILVVYALRNISEGEEILTAYFDTKKPRDQRRQHLLERYKFHCTCKVCSLPSEASDLSDLRLQQMTSSKQKLSAWSSGEISGTEAVDIIRSVWKLGGEEGYWSERGQLAADAVHVAAAHSDEAATKQWALLAQEWFGYELGRDSTPVADMRSFVENPRLNPNWGTRNEHLNVGLPGF